MTTSSPWAVQMAHWKHADQQVRHHEREQHGRVASSDSHRPPPWRPPACRCPESGKTDVCRTTAHLISATPCHPNGIGGHAPDPVSPIGRIVAPHTTTPAASRPLLSGTSKETAEKLLPDAKPSWLRSRNMGCITQQFTPPCLLLRHGIAAVPHALGRKDRDHAPRELRSTPRTPCGDAPNRPAGGATRHAPP